MSISTPSSPTAANGPASRAAVYRVLLWGAAVVTAATAALGAWWTSGRDDAVPAATVQASPSAAAARNSRDRCGGRHLIALHRCMVRECEKPEFQAHPDCQRVRDIDARAREALGR